jgi:phage terminase large subunit GpA-like protein
MKDVAPSRLPTFLLPCPHCGQRMAIMAVAPAQFDGSAESCDLEDVTHGCAQCGTTLTRTVRPLVGDAHEIAQRF